ncbi:peptidase inhibitor family I36 protein [Streptomyces aurantiacus]|uniref:peptidase inhibitor family I36 protein n=1 Tax=Streptomyces aurantiacus TaxID=47760 RepID=UPI003332F3A5
MRWFDFTASWTGGAGDELNFNVDEEGWGRVLISDESVTHLKDHGFNDCASSAVNKTDRAIALYTDASGADRADSPPQVKLRHDHLRRRRQQNVERPHVSHVRDGAHRLFGLAGNCLDVSGGGRHNGADVHIYDLHRGPTQQWHLAHADYPE